MKYIYIFKTNGQSRDTGSIGPTRHRTKKKKSKHNTINKAKQMNNLITKLVVNPGALEGSAVSTSCKILGLIAHHIYCPHC